MRIWLEPYGGLEVDKLLPPIIVCKAVSQSASEGSHNPVLRNIKVCKGRKEAGSIYSRGRVLLPSSRYEGQRSFYYI